MAKKKKRDKEFQPMPNKITIQKLKGKEKLNQIPKLSPKYQKHKNVLVNRFTR